MGGFINDNILISRDLHVLEDRGNGEYMGSDYKSSKKKT